MSGFPNHHAGHGRRDNTRLNFTTETPKNPGGAFGARQAARFAVVPGVLRGNPFAVSARPNRSRVETPVMIEQWA